MNQASERFMVKGLQSLCEKLMSLRDSYRFSASPAFRLRLHAGLDCVALRV